MTQIDFYTGVTDVSLFCCRLLKKIYQGDQCVVVWGDKMTLMNLSDRLWRFSQEDFLVHNMATDPWVKQYAKDRPALCKIVLCQEGDELPHHDIMINLSRTLPQAFAQFERLVEIVPKQDQDEILEGRNRFKYYKDRGYFIRHHAMDVKT